VKITFTPDGWRDYLYWHETDRKISTAVNRLIEGARRDPFSGPGKPEPLRGEYAGWWSRRINAEHRLVYRVEGKGGEQRLTVAQCRHHY
jgi:toxin YoeB